MTDALFRALPDLHGDVEYADDADYLARSRCLGELRLDFSDISHYGMAIGLVACVPVIIAALRDGKCEGEVPALPAAYGVVSLDDLPGDAATTWRWRVEPV